MRERQVSILSFMAGEVRCGWGWDPRDSLPPRVGAGAGPDQELGARVEKWPWLSLKTYHLALMFPEALMYGKGQAFCTKCCRVNESF